MISTELANDVLRIEMDDGKANVYDFERFEAFHAAMDEAEKARARAVIFKGRERMFSGGLDTKWIRTLDGEGTAKLVREFSETMLRVFTLPIPTIAQITGHAVAGGCVLACACDRRYALAGDFRLQMNEHLIGMAMPQWARIICESSFPRPQADDLLLMAQSYTPQQARAFGAIHGVTSDTKALDALCRKAAEECKALHPKAFAISKRRARQAAADAARELAGEA